jgi:hypothetical protein
MVKVLFSNLPSKKGMSYVTYPVRERVNYRPLHHHYTNVLALTVYYIIITQVYVLILSVKSIIVNHVYKQHWVSSL